MSADRLSEALTVALDDLGVRIEHRQIVELAARCDEVLHAGQCQACDGGAVVFIFDDATVAELCGTCGGTGRWP